MVRSSYKNLGYPLGCSTSELDSALGDGDFTLHNEQQIIAGFMRVKALLQGICYLDIHLLSDSANRIVDEMLHTLAVNYQVGKFYVQLLPYEHREITCLTSLGFTEEARMKGQLFIEGEHHDLLMMGSKDNRV